jgi:glycosyltransferase involved in cell wall biosynthesis
VNLAFAVHEYERNGGTSGYVVELVTRLAGAHEITVYAAGVRTPPPTGVRVVRVRALRGRAYATAFTFPAAFAAVRGRHDVVHAQGWVTGSADVVTAHIVLAAWRKAAKAAGVPTPPGERYVGALAERFERGLVARATRVIAPSERARRDLSLCYGREQGVAVIRHGFDRRMAAVPRTEARRTLGLPADAFVALYAGDARKGVAPAIAALARVPAARLLVFSASPARPFLEGVPEAVRARVHWAPPSATAAEAFGAADLLLHPTIYDTFGLVVAEAMALGVPVVVSREAGVSELIEHGVSGWLLAAPTAQDTAEALAALAPDGDLRRRLGAGGRAAAARRTWDQVAEETLAVYASVAEGRR